MEFRDHSTRSMQSQVMERNRCVSFVIEQFRFFRAREQPNFVQTIRLLPTFHEIPSSIREYLEFNPKAPIGTGFDPMRTLTPTSTLSVQATATTTTTSPHSHLFPRMNSGASINTPPIQYTAPKENPAQKGVRDSSALAFFTSPSF